MMKNKLVLSAIITAIFAISCQSNRKEIPEGSKLFNLTDYFSGQIKALEKSKTPLTKTILTKVKLKPSVLKMSTGKLNLSRSLKLT